MRTVHQYYADILPTEHVQEATSVDFHAQNPERSQAAKAARARTLETIKIDARSAGKSRVHHTGPGRVLRQHDRNVATRPSFCGKCLSLKSDIRDRDLSLKVSGQTFVLQCVWKTFNCFSKVSGQNIVFEKCL